ncbi:MAG: FixH family protein, partial [Gammaproteobacteria bacterium]|nr:FixH family protein [Gammaproteobacteria bacterium]
MKREDDKPWYKYGFVWLMIGLPASAVIAGITTVFIATHEPDSLVADDYYKRGLAINEVISRDIKAAELGLSAVIELDNSTKAIKVQFDKGSLPDYPDTLSLNFRHATRANSDVSVTLNHGIGNQYIGVVHKIISKGVWYFEIADQDWKLN